LARRRTSRLRTDISANFDKQKNKGGP
jgi:hypothetical protein